MPLLPTAPQDLCLSCQVHPATVPLLSGLHNLEQLEIVFEVGLHGRLVRQRHCVRRPVAAAAVGPCRWHFRDCMRQSAAERLQEAVLKQAVEEGVGWLRRALRGMGREPRVITVGKR